MKKYLILMPLLVISFASSCSNNNAELKVSVDAKYCTISGLNPTYRTNEEVKLKVNPINDYFILPNADNVHVYGADEYQYSVTSGELSFKITRDTTIRLIGESTYGEVIDYNQLRFYNYAERYCDNRETRAIEWIKAKFTWDFSSVTEQTSKTLLFEQLATLGLNTSELSGTKEVTQSEDTNEKFYSYVYKDEDLVKYFPDLEGNYYFGKFTGSITGEKVYIFSMLQQKYMPFVKPEVDPESINELKSTAKAFIGFSYYTNTDPQGVVRDLDITFESFDIGDGSLINGHLVINYLFDEH